MATVTTSLADRAETIFTELGYTVDRTDGELRAERKWRVVQITPVDDPAEAPLSGDLRCFVTDHDTAHEVYDHLLSVDPEYDWAIMGVEDAGEYEVYRAPDMPLSA